MGSHARLLSGWAARRAHMTGLTQGRAHTPGIPSRPLPLFCLRSSLCDLQVKTSLSTPQVHFTYNLLASPYRCSSVVFWCDNILPQSSQTRPLPLAKDKVSNSTTLLPTLQSMVPVSIVCCGGEITGVEIMWHWSMVGVWDGPGLSDKSGWQSDIVADAM